jgi:hypothetical protein
MSRAEPAPSAEPAPLVAVAPPDSRKRPASGEPTAEHKPAKASRRSLAVPSVSSREKLCPFFSNIGTFLQNCLRKYTLSNSKYTVHEEYELSRKWKIKKLHFRFIPTKSHLSVKKVWFCLISYWGSGVWRERRLVC